MPEDYSACDLLAPSSRHKPINTAVMADTGCQSCLASLTIIKLLGLHQTDLIPVPMRMYAANNKSITILAATILRFLGKCKSGATLETREITYVTDSSDKLFLSREACIALRIISESFPTIGETSANPCANHKPSTASSVHTTSYGCPTRQLPQPPPQDLPYAPTEENIPHLQQ